VGEFGESPRRQEKGKGKTVVVLFGRAQPNHHYFLANNTFIALLLLQTSDKPKKGRRMTNAEAKVFGRRRRVSKNERASPLF
jgi:hypothetical protein